MTTIASPCLDAYQELSTLFSPAPKLRIRSVKDLEELRQLHEIDLDAYQECSLKFETFQGWWERYPDGNTVAFLDDTEILASIGLWAIPEHQSTAFIEGNIRETEFNPVSLEECEQTPQQHWYVSGIVLKKRLRGNIKNNPIKMLLERSIGELFESRRVAYPLQILALSEYVEGENLLTRFSFIKIGDKTNMPDGCDLYSLHLNSEREVEHLLKSRRVW